MKNKVFDIKKPGYVSENVSNIDVYTSYFVQ